MELILGAIVAVTLLQALLKDVFKQPKPKPETPEQKLAKAVKDFMKSQEGKK
jgi:hypothetical protein